LTDENIISKQEQIGIKTKKGLSFILVMQIVIVIIHSILKEEEECFLMECN
jgi:hypothetical protein